MRVIRVGTRASLLARTQTKLVSSRLAELCGAEIVEVLIQTDGDLSTTPLSQSKTPGIFVSALRERLLAGEVDVIVHSMKDLPAKPHPLITTAAVPGREDVRDVLVSKNHLPLAKLPKGARVGTSSPRRTASLRRLRPDLDIVDIRGNVDSRINKVRNGEYDATVLAHAGLVRIGRTDEIAEFLGLTDFLPAPGQGALSVEVLSGNRELIALVGQLDDPIARLITQAERSVLVGLGATCATAIGAVAEYHAGELTLKTELADPETAHSALVSASQKLAVTDLAGAQALGLKLARELLASAVARQVGF